MALTEEQKLKNLMAGTNATQIRQGASEDNEFLTPTTNKVTVDRAVKPTVLTGEQEMVESGEEFEKIPTQMDLGEDTKGSRPVTLAATPDEPGKDRDEVRGVGTEIDNRALTKDTFLDISGKDPATLTDADKTIMRKFQARKTIGDPLFDDETQQITTGTLSDEEIADKTSSAVGAATEDAFVVNQKAEESVQEMFGETEEQFNQRVAEVEEARDTAVNNLKTSLSASGFGRSSTATEKIDSLATLYQDKIQSAAAATEAYQKAESARIRGESQDVQDQLIANAKALEADLQANNEAIEKEVLEFNKAQELSNNEALTNYLATFSASEKIDADKKGFDKDTSEALGYVSDEFGNPIKTDSEGNAIVFTTGDFGEDIKVSTFKDANDNTYVYKNGHLSEIVTTTGQRLTGEQLNTVTVPAKVLEDKTASNRIATETSLRKEYNALPEVKTYTTTKSQSDKVNTGLNAGTGAGDMVGLFAFMKMLDPTSVVREGEFATAQNTGGVFNKLINSYNQVLKGEILTPELRKEFQERANELLKDETARIESLQEQYKKIAEDAGARADFVFPTDPTANVPKNLTSNLTDDEAISSLKAKLTAESTAPAETIVDSEKFSIGNIDKIKDDDVSSFLDFGTSVMDETGLTKVDTTAEPNGFQEKMTITRTGTNVAKDTNNPGNITADSIPSGTSKEEYANRIGATGTYLSPNGREYFVFSDTDSGVNALKRDLNAKITGNSNVIKPTNTLSEFQRIYVGGTNPGYLQTLIKETGMSANTQIKDIDLDKLTQGVMKAEGFIK